MAKTKLKIVDEIDGTVLAYRTKSSVELYTATKEIGFSEFSYSWEEVINIAEKLKKLLKKDIVNVTQIILYLQMISESDTEDIVIKSYVELYLKALNESKSYKTIKIIKSRMFELIKRKQLKNQTK